MLSADQAGSTATDEPRSVLLPDLFVTKAKQTGARVSFIENAVLLAGIEGVGAFLRWRIEEQEQSFDMPRFPTYCLPAPG